MTRAHIRRRMIPWTLAPLAGLAGLGVFADRTPALALVNESPSLPRGLYMRSLDQAVSRRDVVAIDHPPAMRAYLSALGMPSEVHLLKRVAASGGDRVCRDATTVRTPLGAATVLPHDRRGVALPAWRGCRTLRADELFLLGDTPGSFDSRYFGPVRRSAVRGVYRETVTW